MKTILIMSLPGSVLFLMLIVFEHYYKEMFSQKYRYSILKVALFLSITPIIYLKNLFGFIERNKPLDVVIRGNIEAVMITPQGIYMNTVYRTNIIIVGIWSSIAFLIFLHYIKKYVNVKKEVLNTTYANTSTEISEILDYYKKNTKIKRSVQVYITDLNIAPFTIGVLKPIIVIPKISEKDKLEQIISHELHHIKSLDGLVTIFRLIIVGIYWFNPIMYLLDSCLEEASELACDEAVTKNMDKIDRKKYGYLIIDMANSNTVYPKRHITSFSKDEKRVRRRIDHIMISKKKTSILAVIASILMIAASSLTVFAYPTSEKVIWETQPEENIYLENKNQMIMFEKDGEKDFDFIKNEKILYEEQFTDSEHNTYEINSNTESKAICTHDYVDGTYQKHTKNNDGSCLTKAYSAKRCSKCGIMRLGSLISEFKYTKCPH